MKSTFEWEGGRVIDLDIGQEIVNQSRAARFWPQNGQNSRLFQISLSQSVLKSDL